MLHEPDEFDSRIPPWNEWDPAHTCHDTHVCIHTDNNIFFKNKQKQNNDGGVDYQLIRYSQKPEERDIWSKS